MKIKKGRYAQHRARIRLVEGKIKRLNAKHPEFDFEKAVRILSDIERYQKAQHELIYASVDADYCKDRDWRKRCSECDCWKKAQSRTEFLYNAKHRG